MTKWTDAQLEAISAPSGEGNILVSAAAGSGKTAVLVERIITLILNNGDIDGLLVVTFTDAAAAEMKEKIVLRLQSELSKASGELALRLQRQLRLVTGADIETIDAFCLRAVRNNFHVLGTDPDFLVADPTEAELLADDTLEELFCDMYEAGDERFMRLIDIYASNRDDDGLKRIVLMIHRFVQTFADPYGWLDEKAGMYSERMSESRWEKEYIIKRCCNDVGADYRRKFGNLAAEMVYIRTGRTVPYDDIESIIADDGENAEYWAELWQGIRTCYEAAKELEEVSERDEACGIYKKYIHPTWTIDTLTLAKKSKTKLASDEEWEYIMNKRAEIKTSFRKACVLVQTTEEFDSSMSGAGVKRMIDELVWLVKEFDRKFEEKKDARRIKEFSDIEHLAYKLFSENENIRDEYRNRYSEILIDEYQDTNGLQDAIFEAISKDKKNMFMVGDLKQSIYRFRGGDPDIFKRKSREYTLGDSGRRIVLSQNFRSRTEILASVNDLFSSVMSDRVGDVVYEGDELIVRDKERECYPPCDEETDHVTEMHCIPVIGSPSADEREYAEASYIADRINEIVNGGYKIYDKDKGCYRKARFSDIAILSRATRRSADLYMKALSDKGINSFAESEDYFERREIVLILSLISVINNRLQDIPLIAVMRSPIGGFTDNELARVKIHRFETSLAGEKSQKGNAFYYAVEEYAERGDDEALRAKCEKLVSSLKRWRGYVKRKTAANLIWTLYEETGFYDFMGALEGGFEAQANLKLLYERARQYEAAGFRGLFNFIRYIERLRNRRDNLSEAKLIGENHDVVRIMTIHKSKGLEFPIVFLAGTGKKLHVQNAENRILLHKDLGFGVSYMNAEKSFYKDSVMKSIVSRTNFGEEVSETMRILYVALTRAREKLIVTSVIRFTDEEKRDEYFDRMRNLTDIYGVIDPDDIAEAPRFADWIIPAAMSHPKTWRLVTADSVSSGAEQENKAETEPEAPSEELTETVGKILDFKYTFQKSGMIPSKTSVTAIKKAVKHTDEDGPDRDELDRKVTERLYIARPPGFVSGADAVKAADKGTAYHDVMENIDLDGLKSAEDIRAYVGQEIKRLTDEGELNEDVVSREDIVSEMEARIAEFFESDFARKRMLKADDLYRERRFQTDFPARSYDPTLTDEYSGEKIIVQGIIDCYFEENGEIVLLDYKTDKCGADDIEAIKDRYEIQLRLYADAIEKITNKTVKQKYLYLFCLEGSDKKLVEL